MAGLAAEDDGLRRKVTAALPEVLPREYAATWQQAQFLSGTEALAELLRAEVSPTVARLSALPSVDERVRVAFLEVCGRLPDAEERERSVQFFVEYEGDVSAAVRDFLWALDDQCRILDGAVMSRQGMSGAESERCRVHEHSLHRRLFLRGLCGGAAVSAASFSGLFVNPVLAAAAKQAQKHCILLWLCGAPSQFETWDPKPGRPSGGPFGSIATSLPGVHFSSLMPQCAGIADRLNVVRSMKTSANGAFAGDYFVAAG